MNRLLLNKIILILSTLSAVIGIGFLFWILGTLSYKGITSIHWSTFTNDLVEGGIQKLTCRTVHYGDPGKSLGCTAWYDGRYLPSRVWAWKQVGFTHTKPE